MQDARLPLLQSWNAKKPISTKPSRSRSACGSRVRRTQRWAVKWREKNQIVNTLDFRYTYISVGLTRVKSANIARSHRCPPGWCRWFESGDAVRGCGGGKAAYHSTTSAENGRYYLFNFPAGRQYRRAYNLFSPIADNRIIKSPRS